MNDQVTVVIPTFNNAKGATDLVKLLALNFPSFHIIIVDDGSDASHWDQLKSFSQVPRLKKIRLAKNFGQHAALYAGMSQVKTTYMITMDDDHQKLVTQIPALLAASSIAAVLIGRMGISKSRRYFSSLLISFPSRRS